ncbi:MAG: epoxyqueuosine reductase QueH [Clostridia bacterium]|nr:epoxyqueuosine reductase QueH [Clostridia bacterium]MDE7328947.1 epoxyqueuosine reductase QueH [Clostridia bacterium]
MSAKRNYQKELEGIIASLNGEKKSLLMHACCAPCSSYCLEYLKDYFNITLFFYNPNITDEQEFNTRLAELQRLVDEMNLNIDVVCPPYNPQEFLGKTQGMENCVEGGERCSVCYGLRLAKACEYAESRGFDYYCSTLSISPYKNCDKLNTIGEALAKDKKVKHLPNDFKKRGGYARSVELSKEYKLYRQSFCGCLYSQRTENEPL